MPPTDTAPPPTAKPTVAPTPAAEYKVSEHATTAAPKADPISSAIRNRMEQRYGKAPEQPTGEAKVIPSQPPRSEVPAPATPPPADDKPAPHVKFITADEQEPVATAEPTTTSATDDPEVPQEVYKSASAQLREAFDKKSARLAQAVMEGTASRKELAKARAELTGLQDRMKALESAEARAKDYEQKALALDEQLRVQNYTAHPEFHERYVKPVAEAMESGRSFAKELMVADGERMGQPSDFDAVFAQPNYSLMKAKAKEIFGDDFASEVANYARTARELSQKRNAAMEKAGVESINWTRTQQERAAQARLQVKEQFDNAAKSLAEKYPGLYAPTDEKDGEAREARSKGEQLASLVLGKPDEMPMADYTNAMAKVYQRAAAFPLKELALQRMAKELEATKARLAKYEASTPDTASAQRPGGITEIGATPVNSGGDLRAKMHASLEARANRGR